MIFIFGDTHGSFTQLKRMANVVLSPEDIVIHVGDFGFYPSCMQEWNEIFPKGFPCKIYVTEGNHENFAYLYDIEVNAQTGLRDIAKNLFHVPRGTVLQIEGKWFAFMGGGESVDYLNRVPNVSWWEQERITEEDVNSLIENTRGISIDYLITHVPTKEFVDRNFPNFTPSDWGLPRNWVDISMNRVTDMYNRIRPRYHIFGHMHDGVRDGNQICVEEDTMIILPE
jgi:Icc-related predicted phosphoesterase